MSDQMEFPETFEKFAKDYGFKDTKEVYTNGIDLIPIFRVKQWLEHLQSNSDEDCISRQGAIDALGYDISIESDKGIDAYRTVIKEILCKIYDVQKENIEKLPSIQPKPKTDVLDKIRAEIKEESKFCPLTEGLERALEIIDKYTAEKE